MPSRAIIEVGEDERILHVFDLPQLYTKPHAEDLFATLNLLSVEPPSWGSGSARDSFEARKTKPKVAPEGVTKYLTSIVASSLQWINDEDAKERIWEQASLRLSERSGRSAMPAMSRTFRVQGPTRDFELSIHEPALTADNMGFKTWAASFLLAKRLRNLDLSSALHNDGPCVLELGSGTGLVGLAASCILGTSVVLSDLPEILPNLRKNVSTNLDTLKCSHGAANTAILDWTRPDDLSMDDDQIKAPLHFPIIVAADAIYSVEHPAILVAAIERWLSPTSHARVVIELPVRSGYTNEENDFRQRMENIGLIVIQEDHETGLDDWGYAGNAEELQEVECWWSIWSWKV